MSSKTLGRIVGALFLLAFVVYMTGGELAGSDASTPAAAADITASQTGIAAGALLMLANSVIVIAIGVLVLPVLRQRHEIAAHAYLVTRVAEGVVMAVGVLGLLLVPLGQALAGTGAGEGSVFAALAQAAREANQYAYQVAMIGLGLGSVPFCRALFAERLVPRPLAALGIVGYPVLAAGMVLEVLGYGVAPAHYVLGGLFEVILGVLLIAKGFPDPRDTQAPATAVAVAEREVLDAH